MNVLYITAHFPFPPNNGARIRDFNLLKRLSKQCEVNLLSFYERTEQLSMIPELEKYCSSIRAVYRRSGRSRYLRYLSAIMSLFCLGRTFHSINYYSNRFGDTIKMVLENKKFDVVQIGFLHMAQYMRFIPNTIPAILDTHNVEHVMMERYARVEQNIFKKIYLLYQTEMLKKYEIKMYPRFDLCLMESNEGIKAWQSLSNRYANFRIVSSGVDLEYFAQPPRVTQSSADLIFTGTMSGKMNIDAVLYFYRLILPAIRKEIPNMKVIIAGADPDKKILELAKHDRLIEVTGTVPDIRPYMAKSRILIVPLRVGAGVRLKIREAMAMGLPVISTSIGCEGTIVTDGKDIIIADTPEAFAREIIRLLRDEGLRKYLADNGRRLAFSAYNWDTIAEKLYATYTEVIDACRNPARPNHESFAC